MTILYFYQYFCSPNGSWGTRVYEFARRWSKKGDKIIVITSIYDKSDLTATGISSRLNLEGIDVRVLNIRISNKYHVLYRIYTFILYALLSSYYALTIKADIVIASSGPITVGIPGLVAKYLRGRKFVFEARDLWPDGAIEMGLIKNKWMKKLCYAFEKRCYKAADAVVTLSPGMKGFIEDKYHLTNAESVPNASDNALFTRDTSDFVLPDWAMGKRIFLYTGNIGPVNNSWIMPNAAKILQKLNPEALFLIIGEGPQKKEISEFIEKEGLTNIRMFDLMPKNQLVAWVQRAYYMLVPLDGKPVLDTSSPNKLFDALAAGIPVMQNTQGWMKDLLANENCGITVPYNSPHQLAEEIDKVIKNPELREEMGKNAKKVALEQFDRDYLAEKMHKILLRVHQK
jgi:glycosyltransferase involved in cell wall biosynthesis